MPAGSQGLGIEIDARSLSVLAKKLRAADKTAYKSLRKRINSSMKPVGDKVRSNYRAGGYAKAAKAVRVDQRFGSQGATVAIRMQRVRAEYARPGATFRHPVFGRDVWVSQPAVHEPFDQATEGSKAQILAELAKVIDDVKRDLA